MPPKVIVICNRKGGTGKTNVAINLSAYLSSLGKKVLLIDLDPQANATSGLGVENRLQGIYEMMSQQISLNDGLILVRKNFWLIPANENLAGADIEMVDLPEREFILKKTINNLLIKKAEENFNYVFIDTPPSLSLLTINSLVAADQILIPVQAEYYALEGLGQLLETVKLVKENLKSNLDVLGAVITMYDNRGRLSEEVWEELYRHFPYYIFRSIIPRNIRLAEAPSYGKTILEYAPQSKGAKAYERLAKEFLINGVF
ncbi:MAG: ParA family protein [Patescibacteria group bacterium]|jgi:chromosome partitioning protein|nr:ParA family protein [Patescibacteria group bacterium]MDD5172901.1 ParA family protein [Patescibacteria group bacterium]